jgi:hypothetical protein
VRHRSPLNAAACVVGLPEAISKRSHCARTDLTALHLSLPAHRSPEGPGTARGRIPGVQLLPPQLPGLALHAASPQLLPPPPPGGRHSPQLMPGVGAGPATPATPAQLPEPGLAAVADSSTGGRMASANVIPRLLGTSSVAASARHDSERMAAMAALAQRYQATLQSHQQQQGEQLAGEHQHQLGPGRAGRLPLPIHQSPAPTLIPPVLAASIPVVSTPARSMTGHLEPGQPQVTAGPTLSLPDNLYTTAGIVPAVAAAVALLDSTQGGAALRGSITSGSSSSIGGTVGSSGSGENGGLALDPVLMATFSPAAAAALRAPPTGLPATLTSPQPSPSTASPPVQHPHFILAHQQPGNPPLRPHAATAPVSRQQSSETFWPEQQQTGGAGGAGRRCLGSQRMCVWTHLCLLT